MNITEIIKKNLLTILSVVAIVSLFFTFISISTESSYTGEITTKYSGFQACEASKLGYLLIVCPIVLIAMNYIKALEKYKGILSMAIPCVCLVILVITFFLAKAGVQAGSNAGAEIMESVGVNIDVSSSIGLGTILTAISYVAMIVFGLKLQKDFSIGKIKLNEINIDMENVKSVGTGLFKSAQEGVSKAAQNISNNIQLPTNTNKKQVDDTLALIERLAKMKDDGILSEEEFNDKKTKLLEEI